MLEIIIIIISFVFMLYLLVGIFISLRNIRLINKEIERRLEDIDKDLDEDLVLISNRIKDAGCSN